MGEREGRAREERRGAKSEKIGERNEEIGVRKVARMSEKEYAKWRGRGKRCTQCVPYEGKGKLVNNLQGQTRNEAKPLNHKNIELWILRFNR